MTTATTITGHQYAPDTGRYIGPYTFPRNLDKATVYLPPNTVLDAPPVATPGTHPYYKDGAWTLQSEPSAIQRPAIENYALLTESAIALMKAQGTWTAADQAARDAATAGGNHAD